MINVSSEFKSVISGDERIFYPGAEITLADGTVLNLDNSRITQLKIEDATSQSNSFQIGGAIINKLTLSINNMDDAYSDYDFTDAVIRPSVGLQLSSSIETLHKGVFTADDPRVKSSTITLTALDTMSKFAKPFKEVAQIFPCTASELLDMVCLNCGVILATTTFTNLDYIIQSRPLDDATSCWEIVSWIAQLGGNFARINTSGALEIKWYDFSVFEEEANIDGGTFDDDSPYSSGDTADGGTFAFTDGDNIDGGTFDALGRFHHIISHNSLSLSTDDVVVTGITVCDNSETANSYTFGQSGYLIQIDKNDLIQSLEDAEQVATTIGNKIVGMRFRPLSVTAKSDPSIEAGDVAKVSDRKGNVYHTFLSNVSYGVWQSMKLSCDAESPARNSATRYSAETKTIVQTRQETEQKITAYDLMVQQMTALISGGYGMFPTQVTDASGGTIYYLHDKPLMADSSVRWFTTSEGMIEQNQVNGTWVTVSGTDKQGNALYNVLYARKISADIIRTGKIFSDDGSTLIDMAYGVANSDNLSFIDNIQSGFPLSMPFNIDSSVSKVNSVLLKYTQQAFRTYSDGASGGGGVSTTSGSGGGLSGATEYASGVQTDGASISGASISGGAGSGLTEYADGTGSHRHIENIPNHSHSISGTHYHTITAGHQHNVFLSPHTHTITINNHTHALNFGIMESAITDYSFDVYVDGIKQVSITNNSTNTQGIIDLTAFITTAGWHTIEIRSTTLKRISAQVNIKSYIRS